MLTSVVIPNFNGENLLKSNLPFVLALGADEVIVVDDGSADDSIEIIRNFKFQISNFKLIENKKNLGFAQSVNKGVTAARGDVVVLLNTDVKPAKDLLRYVIPHFSNSKVFGVSFAESQWSWSRGFWQYGYVQHEPGLRTNKVHETFWVSGGSGAFRKSIWDKLEGFDEIYAPFYWEDVDLCYRALRRGYKLLWEPKAQVEHAHEATISKYHARSEINFVQERNQLIFIWKNITSSELIVEHWKNLFLRLLNSPGYVKIVLAALLRINRISAARRIENKEKIISDEDIFERFK